MDDLISRQETIRFIREKVNLSTFMKRSIDKADKSCVELCERIARELPSAERWIPVTERLPEEEGQYLVSGKWANEDSEVWICEFVRLFNIRGWCNEASRPVIQAWMSLPEPYKGGEKE